jgi:hypothetical protein
MWLLYCKTYIYQKNNQTKYKIKKIAKFGRLNFNKTLRFIIKLTYTTKITLIFNSLNFNSDVQSINDNGLNVN